MVHARRKFYEVHHATASPIALEILQQIAALFAIESGIRGQPPDRRAAIRQEHARPLLDQLRAYLDAVLAQVSNKSTLAQAIRYTLSRWTALGRYLGDGRLEMCRVEDRRGGGSRPPGCRQGFRPVPSSRAGLAPSPVPARQTGHAVE